MCAARLRITDPFPRLNKVHNPISSIVQRLPIQERGGIGQTYKRRFGLLDHGGGIAEGISLTIPVVW